MNQPVTQGQVPQTPDRDAMVREAAYFRYQTQGCQYGHAIEDWLAAEAQVDQAMKDSAKPEGAPTEAKAARP